MQDFHLLNFTKRPGDSDRVVENALGLCVPRLRSPYTRKATSGSPSHRESPPSPLGNTEQGSPRRLPRPAGRGTTEPVRAPTGEGVEGGGLVLVGVPVGGVADDQAGLAHGAISHQHALDAQLRAAAPSGAVSPQGGRVVQQLLGGHGTGDTGGSAGLSAGSGAAGPLPCLAGRAALGAARCRAVTPTPARLALLLIAAPAALRPKPAPISLVPPRPAPSGGRPGPTRPGRLLLPPPPRPEPDAAAPFAAAAPEQRSLSGFR